MQPELAKQEYELWNASKRYMRGEIDAAQLDEVQQRYSDDFTDVVLKLAQHEQKQRLTSITVAILIVVGILIALAALLLYIFQIFNIHNPFITIVFSLPLIAVSLLVTPIRRNLAIAQQKREVRNISMRHLNKR